MPSSHQTSSLPLPLPLYAQSGWIPGQTETQEEREKDCEGKEKAETYEALVSLLTPPVLEAFRGRTGGLHPGDELV